MFLRKIGLLLLVLSGTQSVSGQAPVLDDFNRSALGTSWAPNQGNLTILNGTVVSSSSAGPAAIRWVGQTFSADQFSEIVIASTSTGNDIGPSARNHQTGVATYYYYRCDNGRHRLGKVLSGVVTELASVVGGCVSNDVLRLEARGTQLSAIRNGVVHLGPLTDASISQGSPGVAGWGSGTQPGGDNWKGGNLDTVPLPPPALPVLRVAGADVDFDLAGLVTLLGSVGCVPPDCQPSLQLSNMTQPGTVRLRPGDVLELELSIERVGSPPQRLRVAIVRLKQQ